MEMKAWKFMEYGSLDGLKLVDTLVPEVRETQVLVKVAAVSLNYRDYAIAADRYGIDFQKGLIPVNDTCGYVVKVGRGVKSLRVGDRVVNNFSSDWISGTPENESLNYTHGGPLDGGLAEYMVLEEQACLVPPSYLSDEEVATLPIAALTAWYSLVNLGNLKKGDFVLVEGTGGVSIFAIQFAKNFGAKTIVLTSSEEKGKKVRDIGADHVINYKETPEWVSKVYEITSGVGINHVIEVVGGSTFKKALASCAPQAHIYAVGHLESPKYDVTLYELVQHRVNIHGIFVGPREAFQNMIDHLDQFHTKPVIERVYQFKDSLEAFQHLAKGSFGKLVIKL